MNANFSKKSLLHKKRKSTRVLKLKFKADFLEDLDVQKYDLQKIKEGFVKRDPSQIDFLSIPTNSILRYFHTFLFKSFSM